MQYAGSWNGSRENAKNAQAIALGVCLILLLIVSLLWLSGLGISGLWRLVSSELRARQTSYPDPVCETCGELLDGTHAACPGEFNDSAAIIVARGRKGEP